MKKSRARRRNTPCQALERKTKFRSDPHRMMEGLAYKKRKTLSNVHPAAVCARSDSDKPMDPGIWGSLCPFA